MLPTRPLPLARVYSQPKCETTLVPGLQSLRLGIASALYDHRPFGWAFLPLGGPFYLWVGLSTLGWAFLASLPLGPFYLQPNQTMLGSARHLAALMCCCSISL
jgi:hypothetical protein